MIRTSHRAVAVLVLAATAGCATTAVDDNVAAAQAEVHARAGLDFRWLASDAARAQARADVDAALAAPLGVDDAVRIALAHAPALQAVLAGRAAESADATQAARLPNPVFAFERLAAGGDPGALEVTRSLTLPLVDLLLLPQRQRVADAAQARLRLRLAADVLQAADGARRAWIAAVATAQLAEQAGRAHDAAEAGAELARRMAAAGNLSALQRAREEAAAGDAEAGLAQARRTARGAREALVRALGLDAGQAARLVLPAHLPPLPATLEDEASEAAALQSALDGRLDLRLARARLEEAARAQGWARAGSLADGLEAGVADKAQRGQPRAHGVTATLPLPVFDPGDATQAAAGARQQAALQRAAALAVAAQSQARAAQADRRAAFALAHRFDDRLVPLQATIVGENLLRYNGMLASPFDLLADAREQARVVQLAIAAQRDFLLADADWQAALAGLPSTTDDTPEPR